MLTNERQGPGHVTVDADQWEAREVHLSPRVSAGLTAPCPGPVRACLDTSDISHYCFILAVNYNFMTQQQL